MSDLSETQVVARAQRGEAEAAGLLYEAHQAAIFRYLWLRVGERETAEDLTGEVFIRMLEALPRYRSSATPFRAWLYRIARNLAIDHGRRARRVGGEAPASLEAMPADLHPAGDPAHQADEKLSLEALRAALAGLEAGQREVVTLRFLSGLSLRETAAVVDKTEAAVKALQHRGLAALNYDLHQELGDV
jgi:RNA polymerase sigma-70 factor, ECF subfamily